MGRRIVLVTAGGRGIGAAAARLAAERGYAVAIDQRRDADAAAGERSAGPRKSGAEAGGGGRGGP
jgi:NAD(P)-dependent dehydrogenase (short-subunit alcohol dehydrogenase family)